MQSHINQSESAGPNPVQPTIALAKNIGNIYTSEFLKKIHCNCNCPNMKFKLLNRNGNTYLICQNHFRRKNS